MAAPVRIVVLGNSFAARVQLPALRWAAGRPDGGNEVVGLAGRDPEKARRTAAEHGIPRATGDWRELLALEPDLVLVTTPVALHHEMAAAALDAGAAVLCEKPFALDAGEAADLVARADGRLAWIDHELRAAPPLLELVRRVRAGFLGTPWHASLELFLPPGSFLERPYSWWFDAERGGGVLGALGSHLVDLLRWVTGDEVRAVRAELETFVPERPDAEGRRQRVTADEYARLHLRMESGAMAEVATSVLLAREPSFVVQLTGDAGTLRAVGGEELFAARTGEPLEPVPGAPPLPPSEELGMPEYGVFGRALPLYLREVVAAVREGRGEIPEAATFVDGLATQKVLDAARRSAALEGEGGGWVGCG